MPVNKERRNKYNYRAEDANTTKPNFNWIRHICGAEAHRFGFLKKLQFKKRLLFNRLILLTTEK